MHKLISFVLCIIFLVFFQAAPLESEIRNASRYYSQGAEEAAEGKLEEAIRLFKKSLDINSYYTLAHYGLGKAYLYTGHIGDAIVHLRKATDYDKGFAPAFFYLGMAYLLDKRYNAAVPAFKEAVTLNPSMIEAFYNIGVAYDETGRAIKARIYFEKYLYEREKKESNILF
jgi:tetratricopeptide (TPR) repeat protein